MNLNLWDTAGQEKFRALGRNFYKDSYIIIIVFDITNRMSFINAKEVWYNEIKNYGEKYNFLSLVGNKSDKYEEEEVTDEEAISFAKEIDAKFFLVSAHTGDGIDKMFHTLADNFFDEEFMSKVDQSKEDRLDSIILKKEDLKHKSINCC